MHRAPIDQHSEDHRFGAFTPIRGGAGLFGQIFTRARLFLGLAVEMAPRSSRRQIRVSLSMDDGNVTIFVKQSAIALSHDVDEDVDESWLPIGRGHATEWRRTSSAADRPSMRERHQAADRAGPRPLSTAVWREVAP